MDLGRIRLTEKDFEIHYVVFDLGLATGQYRDNESVH